MTTDPTQPTAEEVLRILQQRFPEHYEIVVLRATNERLRAALAADDGDE